MLSSAPIGERASAAVIVDTLPETCASAGSPEQALPPLEAFAPIIVAAVRAQTALVALMPSLLLSVLGSQGTLVLELHTVLELGPVSTVIAHRCMSVWQLKLVMSSALRGLDPRLLVVIFREKV